VEQKFLAKFPIFVQPGAGQSDLFCDMASHFPFRLIGRHVGQWRQAMSVRRIQTGNSLPSSGAITFAKGIVASRTFFAQRNMTPNALHDIRERAA
jgi:hypothetical protein